MDLSEVVLWVKAGSIYLPAFTGYLLSKYPVESLRGINEAQTANTHLEYFQMGMVKGIHHKKNGGKILNR